MKPAAIPNHTAFQNWFANLAARLRQRKAESAGIQYLVPSGAGAWLLSIPSADRADFADALGAFVVDTQCMGAPNMEMWDPAETIAIQAMTPAAQDAYDYASADLARPVPAPVAGEKARKAGMRRAKAWVAAYERRQCTEGANDVLPPRLGAYLLQVPPNELEGFLDALGVWIGWTIAGIVPEIPTWSASKDLREAAANERRESRRVCK